ncbi:MAG TPA: hypothetical protein VF395_09060, partial [Polyangiaceae bacterium]
MGLFSKIFGASEDGEPTQIRTQIDEAAPPAAEVPGNVGLGKSVGAAAKAPVPAPLPADTRALDASSVHPL